MYIQEKRDERQKTRNKTRLNQRPAKDPNPTTPSNRATKYPPLEKHIPVICRVAHHIEYTSPPTALKSLGRTRFGLAWR